MPKLRQIPLRKVQALTILTLTLLKERIQTGLTAQRLIRGRKRQTAPGRKRQAAFSRKKRLPHRRNRDEAGEPQTDSCVRIPEEG